MNEAGVLSSARLCCPCFIGTTTPSDSLPATFHFIFRLIGLFFTACAVQGRVSLVPSTTVSTCPIPLHRRILPRCVSKFLARSMAFAQDLGARHSLVPFGLQLTVRQDSLLHVTACRFASQGFDRKISLPSRLLATEQLGPYSDRTFTGKLYLAWLGAQVLYCRCFIELMFH
jgi:hypothetical protein